MSQQDKSPETPKPTVTLRTGEWVELKAPYDYKVGITLHTATLDDLYQFLVHANALALKGSGKLRFTHMGIRWDRDQSV